MRDPARIPVVLEAIQRVWEQNPDWRLGQVITNAAAGRPVFYVEDAVLVELLAELER